MEEKNALQLAKKKLLRDTRNGVARAGQDTLAAADAYCVDYKVYLDNCKTEREAVTYTVELCKKNCFVPFEP
ncbi:MAG: aminopeptidase, partial [Clostridia bacterium]|nr:aminopeptidase [Clostridia bacterium]